MVRTERNDTVALGLVMSLALPSTPAIADELEVRGNLDWIVAARGAVPTNAEFNLQNRVLALPQATAQSELRPNLKLLYGSMLAVTIRPRLFGALELAHAGGEWRDPQFSASAEWTDLAGTWTLSETFAVSYGLQNFQWGPAEFLSPSNRMVHESRLLRDALYHVPGRHLVRINLSLGREWSTVALVELGPTDQATFRAGETFEPRGQVKVEWAASDGGAYVGVTAGGAAHERPWIGEYGQLSLTDGLSIYADATHGPGSNAWYPIIDDARGVYFVRDKQDLDRFYTLGVGGLRYTFEGGTDIRAEYVFNDAGYGKDDMRAAAFAARERIQLPPFAYPGLELLARHLVYVSMRVLDLPPAKTLALEARYALSLSDHSGAAFVTGTLEIGDSMLLFLSGHVSHGEHYGEFSRMLRASGTLGLVQTW